ncbi:unnamed protein product [Soboliphyme baturini]|uniref:3'-5' exonuclease domain-containing protein n=1 Tax=Soboliphyme baturini TaxID=241478 RepID=A0A183J095_9BILA|nr:unnamed protein product [Soboliphyme baturini]
MAKQIDEDKKQLILVTKEDEWDKAEKRLKECMDEAVKVVGLDCEFMVKRNTSMPSTYDCQAEENAVRAKAGQVVLLQLSSCGRGVVTVLVRLCYLNRIPGGLAEFLTADDIFKVGVNIDEDCRRLHRVHTHYFLFRLCVLPWLFFCFTFCANYHTG